MANTPSSLKQAIFIIAGEDMHFELDPILDAAGAALDISSGYTATLTIREGSVDGAEVDSFTEIDGLDLATLGATGIITFEPTAAQTLAMRGALSSGVYSLDLVLTAGSTTRRSHEGQCILSDTTVHT